MDSNYPDMSFPPCDTDDLKEQILKVAKSTGINLQGSPGIPLSDLCSTNEEVLSSQCNLLFSTVLYRLERMLNEDLTSYTPQELIAEGLMDAVKLFIKQEPHTKEKVQQGRFRLISSMSLIFQFIERVAFTDSTKLCVENWFQCFSKPGIGFNDEKNGIMFAEIRAMFAKYGVVHSNDISGWDWSVSFELMEEACKFVEMKSLRNTAIQYRGRWSRFMKNYLHFISTALFCTSDGEVFQIFDDDGEPIAGIMKSGLFLTGFLNSIMRAIVEITLAVEAGDSSPACATMGDDCLRYSAVEIPESRYADLGLRVKAGSQHVTDMRTQQVDFCSHLYHSPHHVELSSWPKCIFKMISGPYDEDLWRQIAYEIRSNSNFSEIEEFLLEIGWLPSRVDLSQFQ